MPITCQIVERNPQGYASYRVNFSNGRTRNLRLPGRINITYHLIDTETHVVSIKNAEAIPQYTLPPLGVGIYGVVYSVKVHDRATIPRRTIQGLNILSS